ncbi:response regulator [Pantoea cypripedii]|uniref:DNA-binding dual transcriptional regulator OmpR n=1 Tax=Pantoea cypripedii TaxID=55209 RepID=A0A1X1EGN3_PANCY|nr:response regulator transcription factor [Pantoea cypripedii]MBP2199634.1 DNA-binding response OmpR family regulator [Pantoea cypripedii]ORM88090.1 DNA-binding response regulator [Pantoea cypripedii]
MTSVLLIEDDVRLAQMIVPYLAQHEFEVMHSASATDAQARMKLRSFDVVLLDLMLGDADGLALCRQIRAESHDDPAIIMVTGRGDPADRIIGLEVGADDYLPKPFEPRELLARMRAVLRRMRPGTRTADTGLIRSGELEIDIAARTVTLHQQPCALTSLQFDLLVSLARQAGRVLNREQIWQTVRGESYDSFDRAIDVHIGRIRQVIEDDPRTPKRIITVRGVGYVFSAQADR